jgi:GT2 family glycosyltransferase
MQSPKFSVIIVNYNGGEFVQAAVDSLVSQTCQDFELIVIDNGSEDRSAVDLDVSGVARAEVRLEEANHGFACGNNIAARDATGEWLVLLNPDAVATAEWLENIAAGIARHPGTSMFASLQRSLDDPAILDGIGDCYLGLGVAWRGGFGRPASEIPHEGTCFSPCGAGAVYNRATFLAYGGFDESFFCFGEDTDLAFRMRLGGETCIFLPSAEIHHAGGGVSGRASTFSIWHGARNRLWVFVKNMPGWSFWITLPGHIAITALILLRGTMTGRFRSTWQGFMAGVKGLGPVWKERKKLQQARTAPVLDILKAMTWSPARMLLRKGDVRTFRKHS